jgi:superfamily II DNA/RNA helicase
MSDMGFLPEVRRLLDLTPESRQTLLFSATLDGAVKVLTRDYQNNPVHHEIEVADFDDSNVHHVFWRVEGPNRAQVAANLLPAAGPTIVFCRTRRGADRLATQLSREGVRTEAIHGGRSQNQRDRALAAFKSGRVDALIATDVAARGIHVDGVACVVHFDTPEDEKAYLHRSGRTARAGAAGVVVSFVPHADRRAVARMQRVLDIPGALTAPDVDGLVEVIGPRAIRVVHDEPVMSVAKSTRPGGAPKPSGRNRRRSNARTSTQPRSGRGQRRDGQGTRRRAS